MRPIADAPDQAVLDRIDGAMRLAYCAYGLRADSRGMFGDRVWKIRGRMIW